MVNESIVKYLEQGKLRGLSVSVLKYNLVDKGYEEGDIDEAIYFIGEEKEESKRFNNKILELFRVNAPLLLRVSMGLMYLWFGVKQILNPEPFLNFIPNYASFLPFSPLETVYLNGVFEILFAGVLLLGFFVRFTAFILAIHLYIIGLSVGDKGIMVRDLALATALFVVFLNGNDKWCLSKVFRERRNY